MGDRLASAEHAAPASSTAASKDDRKTEYGLAVAPVDMQPYATFARDGMMRSWTVLSFKAPEKTVVTVTMSLQILLLADHNVIAHHQDIKFCQ